MRALWVLPLAIACAGAAAADRTKHQIDAQYKAEKAECRKTADRQERKACEADARGHRDEAMAQLKSHPERGDWLKVDRARQQATGASMDAHYAAEKERCKQLAHDAKERCVADAKKKYSKG